MQKAVVTPEVPSRKRTTPLKAWAQLLRIPNLLTVFAGPLAGYLLAHAGAPPLLVDYKRRQCQGQGDGNQNAHAPCEAAQKKARLHVAAVNPGQMPR